MSKMGRYILHLEELGEIEHRMFPDGAGRYVWMYSPHEADDFSVQQVMVELLMEAGFAFDFYASEGHWYIRTDPEAQNSAFDPELNIHADTLDAHHQAFALEDWLKEHQWQIWAASKAKYPPHPGQQSHRWRCKRIEWCCRWIRDNGT